MSSRPITPILGSPNDEDRQGLMMGPLGEGGVREALKPDPRPVSTRDQGDFPNSRGGNDIDVDSFAYHGVLCG